MSIVYLVRHGQASFTGDEYDRLSPLGERQARLLGEHFARTGRRFAACCAGSLQRQHTTAQLIIERLGDSAPLQIVPELNEHDTVAVVRSQLTDSEQQAAGQLNDLADFEGDQRAFIKLLNTALLRWARGEHGAPGLETWEEFTARVQRGVLSAVSGLDPGAKALIVASSGPISAMMGWALGLDSSRIVRLSWSILNSSVSMFKIEADKVELLSFNSVAHLELQHEPGLITRL